MQKISAVEGWAGVFHQAREMVDCIHQGAWAERLFYEARMLEALGYSLLDLRDAVMARRGPHPFAN